MDRTAKRLRRTAVVLLMGLGLWTMAVNPATARELCSENGGLALLDGNKDGVISVGEIQALIDAAGDAEGADQLQSLLDGLPGDVTGIRYVDCADGGSGSGDGGSGDGNGGGDTGGNGDTGDGGSGDGGSGSGDGSGNGDTGSGDGAGDGTGSPDSIVIIDGTPVAVDAITGLPATGDGPAANAPAIGGLTALALAGFTLLAVLGVGKLKAGSRSQG